MITTGMVTTIGSAASNAEIPSAPNPTCDNPSPIMEKRRKTRLTPNKEAERETKRPTNNALTKKEYEKISPIMASLLKECLSRV